ncbi:DUF3048 domain-containing protein [Demequina salsinemoris]|uniref:DUF3048 domain-containing protein n=1 Tax=Demequina salsinemoris TaxID=577470 RepID=UPI000A05AE96|nr:DUF3048 domain-containing protein [Demequina salsinemoris]
MRMKGGAAAMAAVALLLAACAPSVESSPAVTASYESEGARASAPAAPEDPYPEVVWPLTGLDATDATEEEMANPALAIKIENSIDARPQENLEYADVVYEEYVEAGISRLVAIFHSQMPESVGPIRSMRPMDKNIMGSYLGPLVFSGAQNGFINQNAAAGIVQITQDRGDYGFYRTSDKVAPHNLHGYLSKFLEQAGDTTTPPQQWDWAVDVDESTAQTEGTKISNIAIIMSGWAHPSWDYDKSTGLWMRSEFGVKHVTTDGTQISATNVVVLRVKIVTNHDGGGSGVPETLLAGYSGEGQLISGDKVVDIEWSKDEMTDPIEMTTTDGEAVELAPGQTWFELIPVSGSVTVS